VAAPHNLEVMEPEKDKGFALTLSNFEGPFDLLLSLISKHELDITEISLSRVTDEFIQYVKQLDEHEEMEQASEFLVIAATLLDLKIVSLLPKGELVDAEDVALLEARDLLFARLLQYKAFKEVSGWFATRIDMEATRVARDVPIETRFRESTPELVWTMTLEEFHALSQDVFTPREIPGIGLTHLHAPAVSIREQATEVILRLRKAGSLTFFDLIRDEPDRAKIVARFLAVLELYRLSAIAMQQDGPLADLLITWQADNFDDEQLANLGADYDA
jgi:segregation and condensation protein A